LSLSIESVDLEFQNSRVKIVALGGLQELRVANSVVGPLEEGREYEVQYWIGLELVKAGYARFYEDVQMTFLVLNQIHWRETKLQIGRQISSLPEFFYPKLRRYLEGLRQSVSRDASFAGEYARASGLARDIVNSRLKKIINLATYPRDESILQALSEEERSVFDTVSDIVVDWESNILEVEEHK
jgi:hypothetical protein